MPELKLGLLENLSLNKWYLFLLYLGGVILILSLFLEVKGIEINKVRAFSVYTIYLGLLIWVIKDILAHADRIIESFWRHEYFSEEEVDRWGKIIVFFDYSITFVALFIWIIYISQMIF